MSGQTNGGPLTTGTRRIRVLVVEDSPVIQQLLSHVISADPRLEVAGIAATGEQALRMIERTAPDVVSLDIRLPGIDGFEVTSRIMRQTPLPIVVVASDVRDLDIPMRALQAGALAVVEKPGSMARADYQTVAHHLCTQLVIMSQIKVVRQRPHGQSKVPALEPPHTGHPVELVAIVASTGGPGALARILGALPKDFPAPIAVVQHIGGEFVAGFSHWLNSVSKIPVHLAKDGECMLPGNVYVGPGDAHLSVTNGCLRVAPGAPINGHAPSGDALFGSVATVYGDRALGVLLTGMGEDGARGLAAMRAVGAHTIAEARSSAVIWGMPGAAVAMGGAVEQLPVGAIPHRLRQLAGVAPVSETAP